MALSGLDSKWFNREQSSRIYLSDPAIQETVIFISNPSAENKDKN